MSMCQAKTQISLGIRPDWSESLLCAQWVAKDPNFLRADSEDSDQAGRIPRLIWVFAERTLILLVLSCRGSNVKARHVVLKADRQKTSDTHKIECTYEPPHDKTNKMVCAPSEDWSVLASAVLAVRMKKDWVLSYPLGAQRRLIRLGGCPGWSESSLGAQSAVSLLVLLWGGSYMQC